MGSGAHDHRTRIAPNKFILRDIIEAAWRVVERASHHAREREYAAVDRTVSSGNLAVLGSQDSFVTEHVGIGAFDAPWLAGPVEVEHQMMLRGFTRNVIVEFDTVLVIAIDEVDLDSGHAPLLIERKSLLHLLHHRG